MQSPVMQIAQAQINDIEFVFILLPLKLFIRILEVDIYFLNLNLLNYFYLFRKLQL